MISYTIYYALTTGHFREYSDVLLFAASSFLQRAAVLVGHVIGAANRSTDVDVKTGFDVSTGFDVNVVLVADVGARTSNFFVVRTFDLNDATSSKLAL